MKGFSHAIHGVRYLAGAVRVNTGPHQSTGVAGEETQLRGPGANPRRSRAVGLVRKRSSTKAIAMAYFFGAQDSWLDRLN